MKIIFCVFFGTIMSLSSVYAKTDSTYNKNEIRQDDTKPSISLQNIPAQVQKNWFISGGLGAQIYFGDHDKQLATGKRITPAYELSAGKWLNNAFGLRVNMQMATMKGLTQYGGSNGLSTGVKYRDQDDLWFQKFTYLQGHVDLLFNWTNNALGVDPNRLYNLIPYAGIGFISVLDKQKGTNFSTNLGLLNTFKINNRFNINADIKGTIISDRVDGEIGNRNLDGTLSVTVGVTYSFN